MAKSRARTDEELLDAIPPSAELIVHPVDLLTVERAADFAGIPKTTIDSAVSGISEYRALVLGTSIRKLVVAPGATTWSALQRGLTKESLGAGVAELIAARSKELAADPAFALLIAGHRRLDPAIIAPAAISTLQSLTQAFLPFLETVAVSHGVELPLTRSTEVFAAECLLAEAYRRMTKVPPCGVHLDRRLALAAGRVVAAEMTASPDTDDAVPSSFLDAPVLHDGEVRHRLQQAVAAGSELLLSGAFALSTRLTVKEITSSMGIGVASFYRHFGSVAEFEQLLLKRADRLLFGGFSDEFFDAVRAAAAPDEGALDAVWSTFMAFGSKAMRAHITDGRPGLEAAAWLSDPESSDIISSSYLDGVAGRVDFYEWLVELSGRTLSDGLDGSVIGPVMNAHSVVTELLAGHAPDPDAALEFLAARSALVFGSMVDKAPEPT